MTSSYLIISAVALFSNKVTVSGTGGLGLQHIFWEDAIQPIKFHNIVFELSFKNLSSAPGTKTSWQ